MASGLQSGGFYRPVIGYEMTSQAQKKKTDPAKQAPKPKPAAKSKLRGEGKKGDAGTPAGLKASENIIDNCLILLEDFTRNAQKILHNEKVIQWQNVPAHKCTSLSKRLNFPKDLTVYRKQYPEIVAKIEIMVQQWQNEIGYLKTDLKHTPIAVETALDRAKKIEQGCASIEPLMRSLAGHEKFLTTVDMSIRNMLTMQGLLQFAKSSGGRKAGSLDEAFQVYRLMTDNIHEKEGQKSLSDYTEEILDIEKRFSYIQIKGLPQIAAEVINHNMQNVLAASKNVRKYLDYAANRLTDEYNYICKIQVDLSAIKDNSIIEIINVLDNVTAELTASLMRLFLKANILKELKNIPDVIEELHVFHLVVKRDFIKKINARIQQENSSINPAAVAVELTDSFFSGFSGMLRIFRLFYVSMKGTPGVTKDALQAQLEFFLNSCPAIYGTNKLSDIKKVSAAISTYLSDYEKPFPFEILFQIFKKAMSVYLERLEMYFNEFKIEEGKFFQSEAIVDAESSYSTPSTLGKLMADIKGKSQAMISEISG